MNENQKKRNGLVTACLWIAMLAYVAISLAYIIAMYGANTSNKILGLGLCSLLTLGDMLGVIIMIRWSKNGFYLIALSAILSAVVHLCVLKYDFLTSSIYLFIVVGWFIILQLKAGGKSAWSQLNPGWDSKHCRHIYQIFAAAEIIIFVLTLIAFGKSHDGSIVDAQKTDNPRVLKPTKEVVEPSPVSNMDSVETKPVHSDEKEITPEKPSKPKLNKEKESTKQDKPKEKKNVLSLSDAANYLDTHSVWDAQEMEQYPDLRDLNKKLIVSIRQGRPRIPHELCRMSKKLKLIQHLLREYEYLNLKQSHRNNKLIGIDYNGSANLIRPAEMVSSIKDAIDLQRKLERAKKRRDDYSNMVDSVANEAAPTFGLR